MLDELLERINEPDRAGAIAMPESGGSPDARNLSPSAEVGAWEAPDAAQRVR